MKINLHFEFLAIVASMGIVMISSLLGLAQAADSHWMIATINPEGAPIRKTPKMSDPTIGTLPGNAKIWVSKTLRDGFYATYLNTPISGVQTAWLSASLVTIASPSASRSVTAGANRKIASIGASPPTSGSRFSAKLGVGPFLMNYSVGSGGVAIASTAVSSFGVYFGGKVGYQLTRNSAGAGLHLAFGGNVNSIFSGSVYSYPILWSGFGEFSYRSSSRFTPILSGAYEVLPLPFPYVSGTTGATAFDTLNTSLFWAGAGLQFDTRSPHHNLKLELKGAYSLASRSITSITSLSYKSPGFKLGLSVDYQLLSIICVGGKFDYLNLAGDIAISGYIGGLTLGIQF